MFCHCSALANNLFIADLCTIHFKTKNTTKENHFKHAFLSLLMLHKRCWAKNPSGNFGHLLQVFDPITTGKNNLVTLLKRKLETTRGSAKKELTIVGESNRMMKIM